MTCRMPAFWIRAFGAEGEAGEVVNNRNAAERDAIAVARRWLDQYGAVAIATVIKTSGSFPVPVGGQLVIGPEERFEGSVSGGCVEAAVITEAATVVAGQPKVLAYGVSDETAWHVGLPCGGKIEVLVERLSGTDDARYLDAVLAARASRSLLVVETDLESGRRVLHGDASKFDADGAAKLASGECLLDEAPGARRFLNALAPQVRVILVGAGHIAQVLADLATRLGFQVAVVDPRTAFSTAERFAGVPLSHDWPEVALQPSASTIVRRS